MNTLHFDYEKKQKKSNLIIAVVAVVALLCTGIGCSHVMKQTGNDTTKTIMQDAENSTSQTS